MHVLNTPKGDLKPKGDYPAPRLARSSAISLLLIRSKIQSHSTARYLPKPFSVLWHSGDNFDSVIVFCKSVRAAMLSELLGNLLWPSISANWAVASILISSAWVIVEYRFAGIFVCSPHLLLYTPPRPPSRLSWKIDFIRWSHRLDVFDRSISVINTPLFSSFFHINMNKSNV